MAEISSWYNVDDEDLYSLSDNNQIGILGSTRTVVEQGEYVWINKDQVERLSEEWIRGEREHTTSHQSLWNQRYHFQDGTERTVNWVLVLDALNFCFWAEKNQTRWSIDYKGETLNGYWAEAASLKRAVEEGIPLWDAEYLSTISTETMAHIFRGSHTIPLFEQRVKIAREVGHVLLEHFDGQFTHAIEQAERNAVKLVLLLTQTFPSFNDIASYHARTIKFFKRAQICVADLVGTFKGKGWGAFSQLNQLTAFADYKLPQVLRYHHVLEYHAALAERIDSQELLVQGSEEEVEIRAATIWACELLRRAMLQRGRSMTALEIDQRLWLAGQDSGQMHPYHRTRTIYY